MSMFSHAAIASLNNLEMLVYNYVIKNRDKVMYMTIRELADAVGVSTTTVLRFCRKLKCEGYSEFRVRFKLYLELSVSGETEEILRFASQFSLHNCKVLSVTSHEHSRLAKLADFNLSWHVPQTRIAGVYDITTQIPVIYILESLGRKLAKRMA